MPVIDGEGLFAGKRLRRCSDKARLYWPYLFCSSNGFGRFEIDYPKLIAHCFLNFKQPPTQEDLMVVIEEYRLTDLLFTWTYRDELWGQWDTKDKFLKRHKSASDRESPEPPAELYTSWRKRIKENKDGLKPNYSAFLEGLSTDETLQSGQRASGAVGVLTHVQKTNDFGTFPKISRNSARSCENVRGEGIGIGIGKSAPPSLNESAASREPTGFRRFQQDFPGEVNPDWDARLYLSAIVTAADELMMFANLTLWKKTKKWQQGFIPTAENYIRKGTWKVTPKANAMGHDEEYPKEILK